MTDTERKKIDGWMRAELRDVQLDLEARLTDIDRQRAPAAWDIVSGRAEAIRTALAEIDALRAELADLRAKWDASVERGNVAAIDAMQREAALRAEVADLRSRALPKAWVEHARILAITMWREDFTGARIESFRSRIVELFRVAEDGDYCDPRGFPTLADALRAASDAS